MKYTIQQLPENYSAYMNGRVTALREAVAILEAEAVGKSALFNNKISEK